MTINIKNISYLFTVLIAFVAAKDYDTSGIVLKKYCPPGFELIEGNICKCHTLYDQYNSLRNAGVGGLKTALPEKRDNFSPQQIDLGRYLFFDPILSPDNKVSCATCHNPELGFSDGLSNSIGILDKPTKRSAPSLWNVAYLNSFFWDGRASTLEEQMKGPLYAEDEMGNTPENLSKRLNENSVYKQLFIQAFPESKTSKIELEQLYIALAAFESSLISLNSRYDQYAHGYHNALNKQEIEGLNVFRSFVARCAECHTPPLFTNQQIAVLGVPNKAGQPFDPGAEIPFKDKSMRGGFKVPSLRNIEKTSPYMHGGQFSNLRETVEFYNNGRGHALPKGEEDLILHWHIWEPDLTDYELDRLVDFLKTLTDEQFKPTIPTVLPSGNILQTNNDYNTQKTSR